MNNPRNGTHYWHRTKAGVFALVHRANGWVLCLGDEPFDGPFANAESAKEELVGGHSAWPSAVDPSTLGIPDDLSCWDSER